MSPAHDAVWFPLSCGLNELRVCIDCREPSPLDAASEELWAGLCENNPRLFDGPILSFVRLEGRTIHARVESYKRLVTHQPGVCHLSVTGVLERASQQEQTRSVLMGLRSESSGVHPGMWELVPSGGLEVPRDDQISGDAFMAQLIGELHEEVGLNWSLESPRILGLVIDPTVPSCDVVIRASVPGDMGTTQNILSAGSWEHTELRWVQLGVGGRGGRVGGGELDEFLGEQPCIPTVPAITRALMGTL